MAGDAAWEGAPPHPAQEREGYLLRRDWVEWLGKGTGEVLHTFAIITTEANDLVKSIHDRMLVILSPEAEELWLDEHEKQEDLLSLLKAYAADEMKAYAVSQLVNSLLNNIPEVIDSL